MTNKVVIIDALSHLRVRMENEPGLMFLRGVMNDAFLPGMRIWVWDGPRASASRKAIYPAYKTRPNRDHQAELNLNLVRDMLDCTSSWQIRMPDVEGDDVIAALTAYFLRAQPQSSIEVLCRDSDLVALAADPRVSVSHQVKGVEPRHIRLRKLCLGKPSDTIPGIKGFGQKAWDAADKDELQRVMNEVLAGLRPDTSHLMSKASSNWLEDPENVELLRVFARVIDPIPIPDDQLNRWLKQGSNDPLKLAELQRTYLL